MITQCSRRGGEQVLGNSDFYSAPFRVKGLVSSEIEMTDLQKGGARVPWGGRQGLIKGFGSLEESAAFP